MAWAYIQTVASADGSSGNPISVTLTGVGAGDLLVGMVTWDSSSVTLSNVTDNASHTFTVADNKNNTTDSQGNASFYFLNETAGSITVSANFSATAGFARIVVSEYSGLAAVDGHTGIVQIAPGTGTNAINSGSIITTGNGDLIWSGVWSDSGTTTLSAGTSPNAFTSRSSSTGPTNPYIVQDFLQTSAGSIAGTATTSASVNTCAFVIGFSLPSTSVPVGKLPSTLLLPPMRQANQGESAMIGWRGLRQLKAYPPPPTNTAALLGQSFLQVKNLIQSAGSVPILGRSTAQVKALEQARGSVSILGYSEAQTKAFEQPSGIAAVIARSETQIKAQEQTSGTLPIVVRFEAQTKALSSSSGSVKLTSLMEAQVKALPTIIAGFLLFARSTLMSKSSLNPTSLSAAISARSTTQAKATDQPSGSVNITSRAEAMAKALAGLGTGGFAALIALVAAMSKSSASTPNLSASLRATAESQAKTTSSPSGRVFLLGDAITQVKTTSSLIFGNFANLVANAVTSVRAMLSGATLSGGLVTGGKQWDPREWERRVLQTWMKYIRTK